ncbi:ligand-binding protein SH3 [Ignicoccus pacificus DSM 13166]|uniref:Ligand-binding protein SH3 n=1 Tax=Ignicoccus pacificus DSM 13166 TaxID=940294 RepID=A0A977K9R4_9CREN|nr:ligand-binding protein SH3 [Ignicoccus pacificus DSM 13166]
MNCLYSALISALPVVEIRGAIPYLIANGCPLYFIVICYVVGTLTGFLVYLFLEEILRIARNILHKYWKGGLKILDKIVERAEKGAGPKVEKYGTLGLALFVAIPAPGTGVWTGAMAGYLLGLKKRDVLLALALGNLGATIIVTLLSLGAAKAVA